MAPNPKVAKAFKAMKEIGVPEETVKPVLKNLLKLYDKNWKYIEDENYAVLVDAIFDREDPKESCLQDAPEECEPSSKRSQFRRTDESSPSLGDPSLSFSNISLRTQHTEEAQLSQSSKQKIVTSNHQCQKDGKPESKIGSPPEHYGGKPRKHSSSHSCSVPGYTEPTQPFFDDRKVESIRLSPQMDLKNNGEASFSPQNVSRKKIVTYGRRTSIVPLEELTVMPDGNRFSEENVHDKYHNDPMIPETKPSTDNLPQFEVPLAFILPGEGGSSKGKCADAKENCSKFQELIDLDADNISPPVLLCDYGSPKANFSSSGRDVLEVLDTTCMENKEDCTSNSSQIDIASSPKGDVKIALICSSPIRPDFRIPSLDAVLKRVEEKYLTLYRITEPSFSLLKLMKDMCECFLAEGTISNINLPPTSVISKNSNLQDVPGGNIGHQFNFFTPSNFSDGSVRFQNLIEVLPQIPRCRALNGLHFLHYIRGLKEGGNPCGERDRKTKTPKDLDSSTSSSIVIVQKQHSSIDLPNFPYYVEDITRGAEHFKISLVNEISNERQPEFHYIPKNVPYHNAYVKFLLARISDDNCCSNCFGDCLSLDIPCACAGETGGEFAYAPGGLIKERFLESCISMNRDPQQHNLFYCQDCPLERSKDKSLSNKCKGHLVRKFIKECWYKCGCSMKCGNRVVQRGITVKLQVFMTPKRKGWGLRTLEDLSEGAFICEYVGEVVTNTELYERNTRNTDKKHTYPVLLDADWSSEGVLKDEEALCLDATFYGNVARFINHRCCDANLVEIPVEVETPDHHYYHLAFFTTRKVNACEELTWDYGIDFDDHSHPVKAFQCHCGSKLCRDVKRRKRTRYGS